MAKSQFTFNFFFSLDCTFILLFVTYNKIRFFSLPNASPINKLTQDRKKFSKFWYGILEMKKISAPSTDVKSVQCMRVY